MNVMEGFIQLEEDIQKEINQEYQDFIDKLNEDL
jgi:hypothetical protein